jgi:hypothetical protein
VQKALERERERENYSRFLKTPNTGRAFWTMHHPNHHHLLGKGNTNYLSKIPYDVANFYCTRNNKEMSRGILRNRTPIKRRETQNDSPKERRL